jgi:uncharacterized membrane protein YqgA involved in biofilm formation
VPDQEPKRIPEVIKELKELTITYAKQETIDPLKDMVRWVGFGVGGSLILAIGLSLLGLAGLRALQTETGSTFTGNLTWIPYLIVATVLGFIAGASIYFGPMKDGRQHRERREAGR